MNWQTTSRATPGPYPGRFPVSGHAARLVWAIGAVSLVWFGLACGTTPAGPAPAAALPALAVAQPANVRGLEVTVVEMQRAARPAPPAADPATGLFPSPVAGAARLRAGEELLGLRIRYVNRGAAPQQATTADWFVRTGVDDIHRNAVDGAAGFGPPLAAGAVAPGGSLEGWVAFAVAADAPELMAGYRLVATFGGTGTAGGEAIGALWRVSRPRP